MLAEPLPPSLSSAVAFFGDIGPVCLEKTNEFNLSGIIPCKYSMMLKIFYYEVVPAVEKFGITEVVYVNDFTSKDEAQLRPMIPGGVGWGG